MDENYRFRPAMSFCRAQPKPGRRKNAVFYATFARDKDQSGIEDARFHLDQQMDRK